MAPELVLGVVLIVILVVRAIFEVWLSGPGPLSR